MTAPAFDLSDIKKERARRSMLRFVLYNKPDYRVNWHHVAMCEKLDAFAKGEITLLMIFVPPQHGKSELSSRQLPAYILGRRPDTRIAVCSYSSDLSSAFNRDSQRIIDTPEYRQLFPRTVLAGTRTSAANADNVTTQRNSDIFGVVGHKGFFKSAYIRGPLTGTSVDIGIIDDPFKDRIEAESQRIRDNVWNWYTDVFSTRLHNKSQQLILLTRWHEDDLAGRILKEDDERAARGEQRKWTVVKFPAIKETMDNPDDPREIGEALWEDQHSAERILDQKAKSPRTFNSLYQQDPRPLEGNIIKADKFGSITWHEFIELTKNKIVKWDFQVDGAYTANTANDPSAVMSSAIVDNITYIRRVSSVHKELPELCDYLQEFAQLNGYSHKSLIEIEPKANGLSTVQSLKKGTKLNVLAYKFPRINGVRLDDKDKVTRAHAVTEIIHVGRVVLIEDGSGWTKRFKDQCAGFPNAAHDDEVDCLVMQLIRNYFGKAKKKIQNSY